MDAIVLQRRRNSFYSRACVRRTGYPFEIVFADINHDGKLDIVVSGQGISVLLGNGDGTFQSAVTSLQGTVEYHIALARFDGTSQVDVAYTDEFSVEISHGDGNGYFVPPVNYPTAETPFDMQVGDFMDTGQPGVAILENTGEIQIWPGETGGVFGTPQSITMTKHYFPGLLAEGDFNGDEIPDIVAAGAESPLGGSPFGMQIFLGGAAGLQPQTTNMGLPFVDSFAVGDFNSDGKQDVVYVGNNAIAVAFGDGQGKLISDLFKRVRISCPGLRWLISTATAYRMWSPGHFSPSAVVIWIGKGDGTFQAPVPIPVASDGVPNVAVVIGTNRLRRKRGFQSGRHRGHRRGSRIRIRWGSLCSPRNRRGTVWNSSLYGRVYSCEPDYPGFQRGWLLGHCKCRWHG